MTLWGVMRESQAEGSRLDEEWVALAMKMLKGADPEERLTWKTPRCVGEGFSLVVPLPLSGYCNSYPFMT